jgi:hypothetical protein
MRQYGFVNGSVKLCIVEVCSHFYLISQVRAYADTQNNRLVTVRQVIHAKGGQFLDKNSVYGNSLVRCQACLRFEGRHFKHLFCNAESQIILV